MGLKDQRVSEGRLIGKSGAVAKVEAALAELDGDPDVPVITHATILRAAREPNFLPNFLPTWGDLSRFQRT